MAYAPSLQSILYGTFQLPDAPGRHIGFNQPPRKMSATQRAKASEVAVAAVISKTPSQWYTAPEIAFLAGICQDTAIRVLNRLASRHVVSKRRAISYKQGPRPWCYKWIESAGGIHGRS